MKKSPILLVFIYLYPAECLGQNTLFIKCVLLLTKRHSWHSEEKKSSFNSPKVLFIDLRDKVPHAAEQTDMTVLLMWKENFFLKI